MSSSRPGSWLAAFGATAALLCGGALALTLAVDPSGYLRDLWPTKPQLCAAGIRVDADAAKLGIPARLRPEEVLIGNSRVQFGFGEADARKVLGRPAANLSIYSADFLDIDAMLRRAAADAPLRRVWIGVDFSLFYAGAEAGRGIAGFDRRLARQPTRARLRQGLAANAAVQASIGALLSPAECARPALTNWGFVSDDDEQARMRAGGPARMRGWRAVQRERLAALARSPRIGRRYRERIARAHELIRDLRARNVEIVLLLGPSHPELDGVVAEVGLGPAFARWRSDMDRLAAAPGVQLVELPAEELARTGTECREEGRADKCPFMDLTHYRPFVGRMMLERALAARR